MRFELAQLLQAFVSAGVIALAGFVFSIVQRVKSVEKEVEIISRGVKISFASDLIKNPKATDAEMNDLLRKFIEESITGPELNVLVGKLKDTAENGPLKDSVKAQGLLKLIHLEGSGH